MKSACWFSSRQRSTRINALASGCLSNPHPIPLHQASSSPSTTPALLNRSLRVEETRGRRMDAGGSHAGLRAFGWYCENVGMAVDECQCQRVVDIEKRRRACSRARRSCGRTVCVRSTWVEDDGNRKRSFFGLALWTGSACVFFFCIWSKKVDAHL